MFYNSFHSYDGDNLTVRPRYQVGLNRTGHMSFLTGQDRTHKFAGQVLPDRTESGLVFLTFYLTSMGYQFSYDKVPGHKFGVKKSKLGCI